MHTYWKHPTEPKWMVGHYNVGGKEWEPMRTFDTQAHAARYVNYLNGGNGEYFAENPR